MAKLSGSRLEQAKETADALLDELELGTAPIMNSILKAKRLARLMRDQDAEIWLDLEAKGYPNAFNFGQLGTCERYARAGGRIDSKGKYYLKSIPQFEADLESSRLTLQGIKFPENISPSVSSSNPHEMTGWAIGGAVQRVLNAHQGALANASSSYSSSTAIFCGLKSSLHSYATDSHHALSLGDVAQSIFDKAREFVDRFVRSVAPKAAEQLSAAFERYDSGESEALSHALTSCRRLILTIADAVFPAQNTPYIDSTGKSRKVGAEEYKNRLLAFLDMKTPANSRSLIEREIDLLANRLDALFEKTCKGVHSDVTADEVRLTLISTYLVLSEVVRVADMPSKVG